MSESEHVIYVTVEEPYQADADAVTLAAWCALDVCGAVPPLALAVIITSDAEVQRLNLEYAGIDSTTDVLSFPAEDQPYATEPDEPPYLGDVIIAYPVAEEQAWVAGHPVLSELQLLTIHGTLHLMGYDHDTPENQAEMWALQSAAMDAVRAAGGS
jgi:probable rRNA maturation factor